MFHPNLNDALSQNFMKLGLLVTEKNLDTKTDKPTRFMFYKYRKAITYMTVFIVARFKTRGSYQICHSSTFRFDYQRAGQRPEKTRFGRRGRAEEENSDSSERPEGERSESSRRSTRF